MAARVWVRVKARHRTFGQWARRALPRDTAGLDPCPSWREVPIRMDFLIVLAALCFLMYVAYRGHSVILFAPVAAPSAIVPGIRRLGMPAWRKSSAANGYTANTTTNSETPP